MPQEIRGYIFDLDGVLFATQRVNDEAYRLALKDHDLKVGSDFFERIYGNKFENIILEDHPQITAEKIKAIKKSKHHYYSQNVSQIKPNLNLLDFIRFSKSHVPVGLATSAAKNNALMVLEHFKVLELFSTTVFFEDIQKPKPDPECFLLCAQRLQVPIEHCMIWEDSKEGLEAARLSGAHYTKIKFE